MDGKEGEKQLNKEKELRKLKEKQAQLRLCWLKPGTVFMTLYFITSNFMIYDIIFSPFS